jgi:hypothetical protein
MSGLFFEGYARRNFRLPAAAELCRVFGNHIALSRSPEAIRKVAIRLGISLSKNKRRPARANG